MKSKAGDSFSMCTFSCVLILVWWVDTQINKVWFEIQWDTSQPETKWRTRISTIGHSTTINNEQSLAIINILLFVLM